MRRARPHPGRRTLWPTHRAHGPDGVALPVHSQTVTEPGHDAPADDEREEDGNGAPVRAPSPGGGPHVSVRDRGEAYERAQVGRASAADQLRERSAGSDRQIIDPRWAALDSSMVPDRPRRPLRLIVLVVAVVVVVAIVAVAGWWLMERESSSPENEDVAATETADDNDGPPAEAADPEVLEQASAAPTPPAAPTADEAVVAIEVPAVETIRTVPAIPELIVQIDGESVVADASGVIDVSTFDQDSFIEVIGVWAEPALIQVELSEWSDRSRSPLRRLADVAGPEAVIGFEVRRQVVVEVEEFDFAPEAVWFQSPQSNDVIVPVGEPTWITSRRSRFVDGTPGVEIIEYQVAPFQGLSSDEVFRPVDVAVWNIERR